jgi:hypothetical protein
LSIYEEEVLVVKAGLEKVKWRIGKGEAALFDAGVRKLGRTL